MKKAALLILGITSTLLVAVSFIWSQRSNDRTAEGGGYHEPTSPNEPVRDDEIDHAAVVLDDSEGSRPFFDIRREFERANDLYSYLLELEAKARDGNADAMWMMSRVYDYCATYASNPANYARDTDAVALATNQSSSSFRLLRAKVAARCAGFARNNDAVTSQSIAEVRLEAAKKGSLPAEAALLAARQPLSQDPAYEKELVRRVQDSRDPEAYLALSEATGVVASGRQESISSIYGAYNAELAWQLAACKVGLDCGPSSALMTMYCVNGGVCSQSPSQDFSAFVFDAGVPRQSADRINEMVNTILASRR